MRNTEMVSNKRRTQEPFADVLKFYNIHGKTVVLEFYLNKGEGLQACILIKKGF